MNVATRLPGGLDVLLRGWDPSDAALLQNALELSRADLEEWTPWVLEGATDIGVLTERLVGYQVDLEEGRDCLYAITNPQGTEVFGGAGLYDRVGAGGLEIGYWVRSDKAGLGIATWASAQLGRLAFSFPETTRVEIHCRADHAASLRIAQKLGYCRTGVVPGSPSRPGDTEVWEMTSEAYPASLGAQLLG